MGAAAFRIGVVFVFACQAASPAEEPRGRGHWAFVPPTRPEPPRVLDSSWPRHPIDAFVLARLEADGLAPSPAADQVALLRRVTLDLTGLPPAVDDVEAFLADPSPCAYEKAVDRLLASPRHGEHMAARWLDAARYADSNGYQSDGERFMWRWRDWVIDAFNSNMPYDRFTREQLAGDLLPEATLESRIATGFNRNHRGNGEGGVIPEEYAVEYVVDRVETSSTVWLGLTLGCARCHDHKYDPFTQEDFYRFFAFFNNVPEKGRAEKHGNSAPLIPAPTREQSRLCADLERRLRDAEERLAGMEGAIAAAQAAWEATLAPERPFDWAPRQALVASHDLEGTASEFNGERFVDGGDVGAFGFLDPFTVGAWVRMGAGGGGTIVSRAMEVAEGQGYALGIAGGKLQLNLVQRWLDDALRLETKAAVPVDGWHHVLASYDGSRAACGVRLYIDGEPQEPRVLLDELNQSFATKEPLRIGAGGGPRARFRGGIRGVRVYARVMASEEAAVLACDDSVTRIAHITPEARSRGQAAKVRAAFLDGHAPEAVMNAVREAENLAKEKADLVASFSTCMVMEEMAVRRPTYVLVRGEYDKQGKEVEPGVPELLLLWPAGEPRNRLGLASWVTDPRHPLTARVAVNHIWQDLFGEGLVRTAEDFGTQGEPPSHPELLDWLATELVRSSWDLKALQRAIVASASYRQSSRLTPELLAKDPENRLLGRGPRVRLSAEAVRDQALAASGLLVERLGGPSVKPYQPAGLWKDLGGADYHEDSGEKLYRRGLYTFWKRTVPPPAMMAFDAAGREACRVRETRTNTPLQALALLNETTFIECARGLAGRASTEGGSSSACRVAWAFRLVLGREPGPEELAVLLRGHERELIRFRAKPEHAAQLLSVGQSRARRDLDPAELAALTVAASMILNLDEAVTKE